MLTTLYAVGDDGAHLMNVTSGEEEVIRLRIGRGADRAQRPWRRSPRDFRARAMEFHAIGDCVTPRRMSHAVFEAHRLAGAI